VDTTILSTCELFCYKYNENNEKEIENDYKNNELSNSHVITFNNLLPNKTYTIEGMFYDDPTLHPNAEHPEIPGSSMIVDTISFTTKTFGDITSNYLYIYPNPNGFDIYTETSIDTKMKIINEFDFVFYEDAEFNKEKIAKIKGLYPNTDLNIKIIFIDQNGGEVYSNYLFKTTPEIEFNKLSSIFKNGYNTIKILENITGNLVDGITLFLNQMKTLLRYSNFSDFIAGTPNLDSIQKQTFEDQFTYYAMCHNNAIENFCYKAEMWFKYDNVQSLDPKAAPLTDDQKKVILLMIKSICDQMVTDTATNKIKTTIEELNNSSLVNEDSPLRIFYNQISEKQLDPKPAFDLESSIHSGITIDTENKTNI
jgi:hypothetical protein